MFRWGIMSTAKIGREHLNPAIMKSANGVISAIASRDPAKAQTLASSYNAPHAFGSYQDMLDSDVIDGVYIPLTTNAHVEWAIKTADAGKHALVEKPLALNADDILPVIEARDRNGVIVSEAFMVTYHPQWMKVRELLAEGAIGTLRQVDAAFTYFNRDPANMRNIPELGGGVIPDIGVYPTVTTRFATGVEPSRVQAIVEFDPHFGIDRYASIRTDYGSFEQTFYISTQMADRQHIAFHGDEGFIELTAPFNSNLYEGDEVRLHNRGHSEVHSFRYTGVDQYQLQVEAFVRAVSGEGTVFPLGDSVRNQRVLDAIYASGKSGNWEAV
ncbi:MAG: Gfo/Idh/MocA family oxidoreductase [Pseudomonadota bacterium]